MSTEVGAIHYDLDLDDSKFQRGAAGVKNELHGLEGAFARAEQGSKMFMGALIGLTVAGGAAIAFGVQQAANLETMKMGFVTLLGSMEKADAAMKMIQQDAAKTPFQLAGLTNANQLLTAVTGNAQQSERMLLNVGKALTAMGKGQPELDRIIVNLQQIGAVGHASAIDIKQFAFAGIPIYRMLNEEIKGTGKNLQDMISNGEITFEMLEKMFNNAGEGAGRFARAFELQGGTFNQVMSNFKDNIAIAMSEFVKQTGIFDAVKNALSGVTQALTNLTRPENMAKIIEIFGWMRDNFPIVAGIILGGLTPAIVALAGGFIALMAPLIPFMIAGAAIGAIIKVIVDAFGGWNNMMTALQPALQAIGEVFNNWILPPLRDIWNTISTQLIPALQSLWNIIAPILVPILQVLAEILVGAVLAAIIVVVNVLKFFIEIITAVVVKVDQGAKMIVSIWTWLKTNIIDTTLAFVNMVLNLITNLINSFVNAIRNALAPVLGAFNAIWNGIVNTLSGWVHNLFDWGSRLIHALADGIRSAIGAVVGAISDVLNKARSLLQGHSPPPEGPFKDLDKWGYNVGMSWVEGFRQAVGGLTLPSIAQGDFAGVGVPAGMSGVGTQNITMYIDKVGDQQDVDAIGRELAFRVGVQPK